MGIKAVLDPSRAVGAMHSVDRKFISERVMVLILVRYLHFLGRRVVLSAAGGTVTGSFYRPVDGSCDYQYQNDVNDYVAHS